MTSKEVEQYCKLEKDSAGLLKDAIQKFNLSARSYFRILKLARTIADLSQEKNILLPHIAEALQYRPKID
jgi:magnesium chelatase family protein